MASKGLRPGFTGLFRRVKPAYPSQNILYGILPGFILAKQRYSPLPADIGSVFPQKLLFPPSSRKGHHHQKVFWGWQPGRLGPIWALAASPTLTGTYYGAGHRDGYLTEMMAKDIPGRLPDGNSSRLNIWGYSAEIPAEMLKVFFALEGARKKSGK